MEATCERAYPAQRLVVDLAWRCWMLGVAEARARQGAGLGCSLVASGSRRIRKRD
jgi:hypothetical protein